jgi:TRAP-type C4-dicarboxylate transport system permease small subunit
LRAQSDRAMKKEGEKLMYNMYKLIDKCDNLMVLLALVSTFVMTCLTTADTVMRYVFNRPIIGAFEITGAYLMMATVFFSVSYAYRRGACIRVTFLVDRLPNQVKIAVNYGVQILSLLFGIVFLIATAKRTFLTFSTHTTLSNLDFLPLWPGYAVVPLGLFFMSLRMLLDLPKVKTGKSALFQEEEAPTG